MAEKKSKDLVGLIDEWAPTLEKTLNDMASKGPKMMNKGRKIAKSKGIKVPPKSRPDAQIGKRAKALIVLGGIFGALGYMGMRRLFGGGDDWQQPR